MTLSASQRTVLVVLICLCLLSLTVAAWAVAKWGFARSGKTDTAGGITVTDSAQVKVQPDTAFVTLGVVTKDKNSKKTASRNAIKTKAVIDAILKMGILKMDVKTVDYSLDPDTDWSKNPPVITGYTASNSVRVRTKDLEKVGDLMDAAIAAGANTVRGVSFDVEDKKKLRQRALKLAVDKAEGKAEAIANALGAKLGPAISASESVDMYMPESRNDVSYKVSVARSVTPISPGETTVSAQVKVVYSVE